MFTNSEKIQHMMHFTKTYEENSHNIYLREARCLEAQFSYLMLPIRSEDLFVGRKTELPIGFWAQNSYGTVGYYCDVPSLLALKEDTALSEKELLSIDYLIQFWKGKTTDEKIRAQYTPDQNKYLSHGNFEIEAGIGWPLYRMSGAQMNPEKLLNKGICGIIEEAEKLRSGNPDFYDAVKSAMQTLQTICLRYRQEILNQKDLCKDTQRLKELSNMADNLEEIAYRTPKSFWQAAQLSYLFYLLSGTYNYGRMDEYLGSYYTHDLDTGTITEEWGLSLLTSLWKLIIERNNIFDGRIILGGKDRKNLEYADRFALAAMETSRRTKDILPQLTLRCYTGMNETVYQKALEVIGEGTTFPMLYNDDVNIPAVANAFNLPTDIAQEYVPFGCGEYVFITKVSAPPAAQSTFCRASTQ